MEFSDDNTVISGKLEINKIVHKMRNIFGAMTSKIEKPPVVIETDFDREDQIDSHTPGLNSYGTFEDMSEYKQCQQLTRRIEEALRLARETELQCEILIPCGLTAKIAQDIMRMSHSEPCGLRGCSLLINLQDKNLCRKLLQLKCDPNTVATFEIYLTLKEDTRGWCAVKKVLMSVSGCFKNSSWNSSPKILCSGFQLEKKKLYRSNS